MRKARIGEVGETILGDSEASEALNRAVLSGSTVVVTVGNKRYIVGARRALEKRMGQKGNEQGSTARS